MALRSVDVNRVVYCRVCGEPLRDGKRNKFKTCRSCFKLKQEETLFHYCTGGSVV